MTSRKTGLTADFKNIRASPVNCNLPSLQEFHGILRSLFIRYEPGYLILILCSFNLKPKISESTPDNADRTTTFVMLYRYGLAESPEILNGLSNS